MMAKRRVVLLAVLALVVAGIAALLFLGLLALFSRRGQLYPEALTADLLHPVRHAFIATLPVSVTNRDASACAATTFTLARSVPGGWGGGVIEYGAHQGLP